MESGVRWLIGVLLIVASISLGWAASLEGQDSDRRTFAVIGCWLIGAAVFVALWYYVLSPFLDIMERVRANIQARAHRSATLGITEAIYQPAGARDGERRDVTKQVRKLVRHGSLDFVVSNEALRCDPAGGVPKELYVKLTRSGEPGEHRVAEGERMVLP